MIDAKRVSAVIFDLGRVLIRVNFSRGLFRYYKRNSTATDDEVLEELFKDQLFIDFNKGEIDSQNVCQEITKKYKLPLSYEQFVYEWCNIFDPMEGMEEVINKVNQKYKLGLLSDIDPLHWAFCETHFPQLKMFNNPTLSFKVGVIKPDPKCYQQAAINIDTDMEKCLFIDDRDINVQGAIHSGMQAIQFTGVEKLKEDLTCLDIAF